MFIFRRMGGGRALSQRPRVFLLSSLEDFLLDEKNPSGPGRPSRGAGQRATPASGTRNVPGHSMPGCGTPRCEPFSLQGRRAGPKPYPSPSEHVSLPPLIDGWQNFSSLVKGSPPTSTALLTNLFTLPRARCPLSRARFRRALGGVRSCL